MAEGGDNETSSTAAGAGGQGSAGGPNVRGGATSGTTRLTNSGNSNSGDINQSCQC